MDGRQGAPNEGGAKHRGLTHEAGVEEWRHDLEPSTRRVAHGNGCRFHFQGIENQRSWTCLEEELHLIEECMHFFSGGFGRPMRNDD